MPTTWLVEVHAMIQIGTVVLNVLNVDEPGEIGSQLVALIVSVRFLS